MIKGSKRRLWFGAALINCCGVLAQLTHAQDEPSRASEAKEVDGSSTSQSDNEQSDEQTTSKPSGPGSFEIDEQAATRALERSLIRSDALLLAKGQLEFGLEYSYQYDEFVSPILIELNAQGTEASTTGIAQRRVVIANHGISLDFKAGLPRDTQIEIAIPVTAESSDLSTVFNGSELENKFNRASATGDIQLSLLKTLVREKGRRPDIIARLSVDTDTGAAPKKGFSFGTGGTEYTLGLSATKRQDPLVFNYGLSYSIGDTVNEVRASPVTQLYTGVYLAASPYTSLSFAFSQTIVGKAQANGIRINGSDRSFGALSLGFSSTIGRNWFLSANLSAGLTDTANDYVAVVAITKRAAIR